MSLQSVNWVDIAIIILLARVVYVAVENGFVFELFELLGLILAVYLSFHYYFKLGALLIKALGLPSSSVNIMNLISFVALALSGYFIFISLRKLFTRFVKAESAPTLHKWGGIILGLVKGMLFASIVVYALAISGIDYLYKSAKNSYSGKQWVGIGCGLYGSIWDGFVSKFVAGEKLNNKTAEVQAGLQGSTERK